MSNVFLNTYGTLISKAVADPIKLRALIKSIEHWFDKNNEIIFAQSPSKHLLFAKKDKTPIYDFVGVTPESVEEVIKTIPFIQKNWKSLNDPFIILSILLS